MDESLNQERELAVAKSRVAESRDASATARSFVVVHAAELLCAALLMAMSLQMLAIISRKNITIDETVMIPAAYYHLAAGNFQLVNEHPPLSKILAGLPLLFVQPDEVSPDEITAAPNSPEAKWAYQESFWKKNALLFYSISFWARVPMIAVTVALGLLIFRFAHDLFGSRAAVLAVALFSLEPTVLGHGRVVQTDIPATFGYLLLFFALYLYHSERSARRALLLGAATGVAIVAKFSMLLAGPVLAAYFLTLLWRAPHLRQKRGTLVAHGTFVGLATIITVNAAYFFQHRALVEADKSWIQQSFPAKSGVVIAASSFLSHFLPADFVLGIFFQLWHNGQGHAAGLLGMYRQTGWWYYFPVAFALKTTLPFLLLSLASLVWAAREWLKKGDRRFLWVLVPFTIYTVFVLFSKIDIGVRYYLPAYPFLFIAGGVFLERMIRSRRAGVLIAATLICWTVVESVRAYPDHISYMNQLASRAPHWWYLSDSNVEWGDDISSLAAYLRAHNEKQVRGSFLGGFLIPRHCGVDYLEILVPDPAKVPWTRYTAIGASFLNGSTSGLGYGADGHPLSDQERVNVFDAYRRRTPEAIFGNSIYLYREDDQ